MKPTSLLLGLLLSAALATPALAGNGNHPSRAAKKQNLLQTYDADGDGKLSDSERAQLRADRRARKAKRRAAIKARFDANGNGTLEPAEKANLKAAMKVRRDKMLAKRFARIDANNDGVITKAEFRQARMQHKRHKGGKGKRK